MARYPALPLWIDAWVASTHHLTRLQRGTYHDLLVLMWATPGCRVPNDNAWLCLRLRLSESDVANELRPLIKEFCQTDGNYITQARLMREYRRVEEMRQRNSVRAKSRWENEKKNDPAMRPRNAPISISKPISKKNTVSPNGLTPSTDVFEAFWAACPRRVGKGAARTAHAKALKIATPQLLLDAMRRYATSVRGEEERFVVHPATWLNQERWLDGKQPVAIVRDEVWQAEQDELRRKGLI